MKDDPGPLELLKKLKQSDRLLRRITEQENLLLWQQDQAWDQDHKLRRDITKRLEMLRDGRRWKVQCARLKIWETLCIKLPALHQNYPYLNLMTSEKQFAAAEHLATAAQTQPAQGVAPPREVAPAATEAHNNRAIAAHWTESGWNQRLRDARNARNHTQKEAASECDVATETYKKWEAGRSPGWRRVTKIIQYIQTSARP